MWFLTCQVVNFWNASIESLWQMFSIKFRYFEKATKHFKFDVTEQRQIFIGRFFQILWPSQNIQTLQVGEMYAQVANSATFYYSVLVLPYRNLYLHLSFGKFMV